MNLSSDLRIQTPEGIVFSYALAGPITRCMAWFVDSAVVLLLSIVVAVLLFIAGIFVAMDWMLALIVLGFFVFWIGYGVALEWAWRGQTFGKKLLGLRVMDARGLRLQFHQVLLRNLLRPIDALPGAYLVGGLVCLLSRRAQRLGDLGAGTVVVRVPRPTEPDLEQLLAGKWNSLREHPHLAARLRGRVSPDEAALALQALLRRESLEPAARVELFARLAAHFKALVAFPPEVVEAMPDEQYLRDVVDVLFRTRAAGEGEAASRGR